MIGLTVRGLDATARRLALAPTDVERGQDNALRVSSFFVRSALVLAMSDPGTNDPFWGRGGGRGESLAARSGQSRARLTPGGQIVRVGDRSIAPIGSPDLHIAFLEDGGTIQARGSYLRVPTGKAKTAQGVDKLAGRSIRTIPGLFFMESRAGNLWAATRSGGVTDLLYLLVRSVSPRGRRVFGRVRDESEPQVVAFFGEGVELALRRNDA